MKRHSKPFPSAIRLAFEDLPSTVLTTKVGRRVFRVLQRGTVTNGQRKAPAGKR